MWVCQHQLKFLLPFLSKNGGVSYIGNWEYFHQIYSFYNLPFKTYRSKWKAQMAEFCTIKNSLTLFELPHLEFQTTLCNATEEEHARKMFLGMAAVCHFTPKEYCMKYTQRSCNLQTFSDRYLPSTFGLICLRRLSVI